MLIPTPVNWCLLSDQQKVVKSQADKLTKPTYLRYLIAHCRTNLFSQLLDIPGTIVNIKILNTLEHYYCKHIMEVP